MNGLKGRVLALSITFCVLILTIVGGFLYWQTETTRVKKPQLNDLLLSYPLLSQTIDPSWKKVQIETTFTFLEGSQIGPGKTNITAQIPSSWSLKIDKPDFSSTRNEHNCSTYNIISPDQITKLSIGLLCGGTSVKYKERPQDSVIITRQVLRGNDGPHIVSRIRVKSGNSYSYYDGMVWVDNDGKIMDQAGDVLSVRYPAPDEMKNDGWWQAVQLTLSYSGFEDQRSTNLEIADKIASSFFLE